MKSVRILSFSGRCFPEFSPNAENYLSADSHAIFLPERVSKFFPDPSQGLKKYYEGLFATHPILCN